MAAGLLASPAVKLWLLGVRGSTPAPGSDFVRYGGHTACVAAAPDGADEPTLILDAGTGIRTIGTTLSTDAFQGAILLSHLHWDHMMGIPFTRPLDQETSRVDLYLPTQDGMSARDLLARTMSPPAFPIEPEGLKGNWSFRAAEPGPVDIEGFAVTSTEVAHKGGRTLGYRIADSSGSMAYLTDHAPVQGMSEEAWELIDGVDVLLHDAQFLESERFIADEYGHATIDEAIEIAIKAKVGKLVLFHHSPVRTDDQLDAIKASLDGPLPIVVASEGMTLTV